MTSRKTRPRSPASTRPEESQSAAAAVPLADDVPATAGMLRLVRAELLQRMDQAGGELRGEMQQMKGELRGEMQQMKDELRGEMQQMKDELRGEMQQLKKEMSAMNVGLVSVQTDIHGLRADMTRVLCLVEEQNVRNRTVLDGLMGVVARQERVERRVDAVEASVRDLAASRRS